MTHQEKNKTLNRLTPVVLRQALAGALKSGRHHDGGGLYLAVQPTGSVAWIFRYMRNGRAHAMGLGNLSYVPASLARQEAARHRQTLALGNDPLLERGRAKTALQVEERRQVMGQTTFRAVAEGVLDELDKSNFSAATKRAWRSSLRDHVYPTLGNLTFDKVDRPAVLEILRAIWATKNNTARHVRQRIEYVFDEARNLNLTDKENPARWLDLRRGLTHYAPATGPKKHAALPWQELPAFYKRLAFADGYAVMALRLAILAATRATEALGARFDEFDLEARVWTIPAERMKGKPGERAEHRIPITDEIADIHEQMKLIARHSSCLFPHRHKRDESQSPSVLQKVLTSMGVRGTVTVHGFRSTFRDWVSDHGYNDQAGERALAHKVTGVAGHYDRTTMLDMRRDLMQQWADYVTGKMQMEAPKARPQLRVVAGGNP